MQAWEPKNFISPQDAARRYYALIKPKWVLNPQIDYWETFNEYSGNWSWQADFYIALMDLAEADGFRLGLWSTSGGNPPLPGTGTLDAAGRAIRKIFSSSEQPYEAIARACRRAKAHGHHILCVHEYAWEGLLKDNWGNDVVGRYRGLYRYLQSQNAEIPIAITECGENGGGGFVGAGRLIEDLSFCDQRWMADPYLIGAAFWTLGNWEGANIQSALPALADYIIAHPTPIITPPTAHTLDVTPTNVSVSVEVDATLAPSMVQIRRASNVTVRIVT
jgi:hypothetical protein